jgi:hypothetical protein
MYLKLVFDANALGKWLNFLEGYLSVHIFSKRENITFALFKSLPHVKPWWENCWEKKSIESGIFGAEPIGDCFMDVFKEKYYPVGNYDEYYMIWTMLYQERGQTMS